MTRFPFAPWVLALAVALVVGAASGPFWHDVRCVILIPDVDPRMIRSRFLACTNLEQRFEAPLPADQATEVATWRVFEGGEEPVRVAVTLQKSVDRVVFYPRVGGSGARVSVYERLGTFQKELFRLRGAGGGWTPIGAQYVVCLSCVENGWSAEEFPVTLEIELTGRGAQLWHKGDIVFFEAP